jgi:hypothetical protein
MMEDSKDVTSIPTKNTSIDSPTTRMSGTMVRKVATRTLLWSIAAHVNLVLPPSPPPPPPPPPPQDEDLPVAKRPRLRTSSTDRMPTAAVVVPTHALTLASSPNGELDLTAVAAPVKNENKGKWAPKEDALLTEAVQKHGRKWVPIAALVPGRTNPQCRTRWLQHLDPTNGKKGRWTPEEDVLLTEAVGKVGKDFTAVAALIPGRTNVRCRDRWERWTPEEDAILTEAVGKLGKDFTAVAAVIPGRTNERCRERWFRFTSSEGLKKGTWTPEEDAKLIEAVQKLGRHWVPVAALVYTRTNTQCRQRWFDNLERDHGEGRVGRPWRTN